MQQVIALLPNILSIIRIAFSFIFACMLNLRLEGRTLPWWLLLSCFMVIVLTDFLDGKIARAYNCKSSIGAVLDVSADSIYIFISLIVLNAYHIIPIWFTIIVILKLIDFIISSWLFSSGKKGYFIFDFLGKFTVGGFYFIPVLAGIFKNAYIMSIIIVFLTLTAVYSSILRWKSFKLH